MNVQKLVFLARQGLMDKEDVPLFRIALKSLNEGKRLTIRQGQLLAKTLDKLLMNITEDQLIYRATLKSSRKSKRERQI